MSDEKLLEEIRARFQYCVDSWFDIRHEAQKDMCFVAGDPWSSEEKLRKERDARQKANRPCLNLDELSQYINQRINDVRQNKRAIKVSPGDNGGDEKTAELHADIIRTIEYKSNAQSAYVTAFENALQRSYGYFRIGKKYTSPASFDQELYIGRIPNPDTVYLDPDAIEADCSDGKYAFVIEDYRREEFEAKWPRAEIKDFPSEMVRNFPHWIKERTIQVAEYWRVEPKNTELLLIAPPGMQAPQPVYLDALGPQAKLKGETLVMPSGITVPVVKRRKTERKQILQYLTNGVEILEKTEWEGKWIPIIPVYGKEIFVDRGAGSERMLMSLIRLARDPHILYCYYRTCQAELVGMTPKTPWVGYEGQFEGHEEEWTNANRVPYSYLQVKPVLDATGNAVLPLPQRQIYEAPIQALETGAESAKRAIQNALGMYNASVGRQDSAAKSGIAIKALDLQSDQGNFHFIDNYDRALEHAGRILDDMIPHIYDTARNVAIRKPDDTVQSVKINAPDKDPKTGEVIERRVGPGDHNVMISTGPSFQSQREEASAFADVLAGNPAIFALIGDLVVKLKNLGPVGDEMAKRLTPPQFQDDKQQNPQLMQQKLAQAMAMVEGLTKQLNQLSDEQKGKTLELQSQQMITKAELESKERIAALNAEVEMAKVQAQIASKENIELLKADLERIQMSIDALRAPNEEPAKEPVQ